MVCNEHDGAHAINLCSCVPQAHAYQHCRCTALAVCANCFALQGYFALQGCFAYTPEHERQVFLLSKNLALLQAYQEALLSLLHVCTLLPTHPQEPSLMDIGLPSRSPLLVQPMVLEQMMPHIQQYKQIWREPGGLAFRSCVIWFVRTLELCMAGPDGDTCQALIGGEYMAPYLKLLSELTIGCD